MAKTTVYFKDGSKEPGIVVEDICIHCVEQEIDEIEKFVVEDENHFGFERIEYTAEEYLDRLRYERDVTGG